jgi:hypothetical protein
MSAQPGGHPTHPPHSYHRLNYSHTRTTDYSYPASAAPGKNSIPQPLFTSRFGFGKRRVSKSAGPARGGQPAEEKVVDCIQKVKIGHLHVYCPLESFDFRISVNCEFPCEYTASLSTFRRAVLNGVRHRRVATDERAL